MKEDHGQEEDEPNIPETEDQRMARDMFSSDRADRLREAAIDARLRTDDGDQNRSTRRRTEERRGTRRGRDNEGDEDDQSRGSTWRRVAAINKAVNDIINLNHDDAREYGFEYDDKCDRETARRMIDDLDKKYERRLKKF